MAVWPDCAEVLLWLWQQQLWLVAVALIQQHQPVLQPVLQPEQQPEQQQPVLQPKQQAEQQPKQQAEQQQPELQPEQQLSEQHTKLSSVPAAHLCAWQVWLHVQLCMPMPVTVVADAVAGQLVA